MVWDLGRAMHKKQEFECARLMDFDFRLRARTMRLLAGRLDLPPGELVTRIALGSDEAIIADLAAMRDRPMAEVENLYHALRATAREQLICEQGNPAPCRLG